MDFGYVRVPSSTRFHTILMHDGVDYELHILLKGKSYYKYAYTIYHKRCSLIRGPKEIGGLAKLRGSNNMKIIVSQGGGVHLLVI